MSARDAWSQDIVLRAMCERVEKLRKEGLEPDFILVTGDLAFSGKADEYELVAEFFDAVSTASGVPRERMFCVPGNHDIDRGRQKLAFHGGRSSLINQNLVDELLAPSEDLNTLLQREENYRRFQESYFAKQERTWTDEELAYVSHLVVEDIRIAIVGMDSAWLADGGLSDHGKLLVGERQVINAIRLAQDGKDAPHIVLSMAHHPCHLLNEFDRLPVQRRVEQACHFFHCGHLHVPEVRAVGCSGTGCLTLAAGASYETRQSHNTFSIITLDLLQAKRHVRTLQYVPTDGAFLSESSQDWEIEVSAADTCSVSELAKGLEAIRTELRPHAYYLSALLLDHKAELPIPSEKGYAFGSLAVLVSQDASELRDRTIDFMRFRNVLRVLYKRLGLSEILAQHGASISAYGTLLSKLCNGDSALKSRLAEQEQEARALAGAAIEDSFSHTDKLLAELADAQDWEELRKLACRHLNSPNERLAVRARRLVALGLAHSENPNDRATAIDLFRSLGNRPDPVPTDLGNLATLLIEDGKADEAKGLIIQGIQAFPAVHTGYFSDIGHRLVESSGDIDFRNQMEEELTKRGHGD